MNATKSCFALGLVCAAACSAPGAGAPDAGSPDAASNLLPGWNPPAPAAGETQFVSPIIKDIQPGADVTLCSYLPKTVSFTADTDIVSANGYQSPTAAHHAILVAAARDRPVDTHVCTDDDMTNTRFLAGAGGGEAGGSSVGIPAGLAFRVAANTQIMMQTHWINATDHPVDGQVVFNVKGQAPSTAVQPAQLITWGTSGIDIAAGADGTAHAECVAQQDLKIFMLGGHAHEHGTHVTLGLKDVGGSTSTPFYDEAWQPYYAFDPPRQRHDVAAPFVVKQGQTLTADCSYHNGGTSALQFPTEMCSGFAFFFPATVEVDCFDGVWPK